MDGPEAFALAGMALANLLLLAHHRRVVARLSRMALTDELTGLINRRAWDDILPRELARAARTGESVSVAVLDLDHFKQFNDRHGHQAGDRLLRLVSAAAREHFRAIDVVARHGGEEFAVLLPGCDLGQAHQVVDRLRAAMPSRQTYSAGVARWNGEESAAMLIARADRALYEAKAAGRDRTVASPPAAEISLILPRGEEAPRTARSSMLRLAGELDRDQLNDLQLLVSELVTNSVRHGSGPIRVDVAVSSQLIRCEVHDDGSGFPLAERASDPAEPGGWGLPLVARVSDRWGSHDGTTHVWFEIWRTPPSAPAVPPARELAAA